MADIFISYSRTDAARVERLVRLLETRWSVFWDRTIPPGQTWDNYIGKQLEDSRCVLVVWSAKAVASEWVREEAHHGRDRGALVPVLFDKVSPPFGFRQVQAADLTTWDGVARDHAVELLMTTLERLLPSLTTEPAAVTATAAPLAPSPAPPPQPVEPVTPPPGSQNPPVTPTSPKPPTPAFEDASSSTALDQRKDHEQAATSQSARQEEVRPPREGRASSPPGFAPVQIRVEATRSAVPEYRPHARETEVSLQPAPSFLRSRMALIGGSVALIVAIAIGVRMMTRSVDFDRVSVQKGDGYTDLVHAGRVQGVAFSSDGSTLAASIDISGVRIWHLDNLERDQTLLPDSSGYGLAIHPSEPLLATVRGEVRLWRLDGLSTPLEVPQSSGANQAVEFSHNGQFLAATGTGLTAVWRVSSGTTEVLSAHSGQGESRYGLAIAPDGTWVAADSNGGTGIVDVWKASELDKAPTVLGNTGATAWDVAFSRDGRLLAAATDSGLHVWEALDVPPRILTSDSTWSLQFSPDGRMMAAGDETGIVTLWRLSDMTPMSKLTLGSRVDCLAFSPDGRTLAAGSFNGTVRLWTLP